MYDRSQIRAPNDWEGLPPEPPDLATAVKDYLLWMENVQLPLDHRFAAVKQRVIFQAIKLVSTGKLE